MEQVCAVKGGGWGLTYVDDEGTQLVLLQRDDLMIARLLRQLEQGARGCQPQPGHVGFAGGQRAQNNHR